jgi:Zn-dependent protease
MSWKSDEHSGYSFAEYNQPVESGPEKGGYADPSFYQPKAGDAPRAVSRAPEYPTQPTPLFSGYTQKQREAGSNEISEYRGPADLEKYTADTEGEQSGAAEEDGSANTTKRRKEGLIASLGGLGAVVAVVAKFGLASISALISIGIYSLIFGWTFAIGLVALLFLHEMGHAVVMKLKGLPVGGMVFIPMLGAAVFMSRMPKNARDEAEVGIAGPIAGALASSVCLLIALANPHSSGVWASLAYFGFFMNLFNLIPIVPFDGGRVLAAIDRRIWIIGFVGLVAIQIWESVRGMGSLWLWLFIGMAAMQLFSRRADTPETQAYYTVPLGERIILGLAYFGLAAVLVLGMTLVGGLIPGVSL